MYKRFIIAVQGLRSEVGARLFVLFEVLHLSGQQLLQFVHFL